MAVEHNSLTGTSLHQPKLIDAASTGDAGQILTPSASSGGTAVLRELLVTELDTDVAAAYTTYEADGAGNFVAASSVGIGYGESKIILGTTATTISVTNTYVEINLADATTGDVNGMTYSSGRLQVDTGGVYFVHCDIAFISAGTAATFEFYISEDTTPTLIGHPQEVKTGSAGDESFISFSGIHQFAASDTITVYVRDTDGTDNPTIERMNLMAILLQKV
jgi:hypothetical protein